MIRLMQRLSQIIAKDRNLLVASPELKKLKHLYRCSAALKDELTLVNNHLEKKERLPKEVANAWEDLAMNIAQKIETIKNSIRELLKQHKELLENFQLLLTISGIGEESAIAILAEVPDIKAFQAIGSICWSYTTKYNVRFLCICQAQIK
jgi:transposase